MMNTMKLLDNEPELIAAIETHILATNYHMTPEQIGNMTREEVDTALFIIDTIGKQRKLNS